MKKHVFLFTCLLALLILAQGRAQASSIHYYSVPTNTSPFVLSPGPDGAMWFTESDNAKIGRVTTAGKVREYAVGGTATSLARDKSGNLWFGLNSGGLGYLDSAGNVQLLSDYHSGIRNLSYNAGKIWLLSSDTVYGSVSAGKHVVTHSFPRGFHAYRMTAGPDGNLWFTDNDHSSIGRLTPEGKFTSFPIQANPDDISAYTDGHPLAITSGPDGALWFTESRHIGRITTKGQMSFFAATAASNYTFDIKAGADKTIWYIGDGTVMRMTMQGKETPIAALGRRYASGYLALGLDKHIWFSDTAGNQIGRVLA